MKSIVNYVILLYFTCCVCGLLEQPCTAELPFPNYYDGGGGAIPRTNMAHYFVNNVKDHFFKVYKLDRKVHLVGLTCIDIVHVVYGMGFTFPSFSVCLSVCLYVSVSLVRTKPKFQNKGYIVLLYCLVLWFLLAYTSIEISTATTSF